MADVVLSLAQNPPEDPVERKRLYEAARELMLKLEDKQDLTHRIFFSGVQLFLADIAADLTIFKTFVEDTENRWTPSELASHVGCDAVLLARILRGLAAYGMITVDAKGRYGSAPATRTLADPGVAGCIRHNALSTFPAFNALPQYLRQTDHKNPVDANNGAAQLGHHTDQHMWQWVESHPENLEAAIINMASQRVGQDSWIEDHRLFPSDFFQLPKSDASSGRVVFVDIGSGSGHQSISLRQVHPEIQGRIVIQDLAHTITRVDTEYLAKLRIEPMEHDFFTSQPVKSAKVYYMRNVLHDFPDDRCEAILRQIRAAMDPDSVLIIDEVVVKEPQAHWQQVNLDILMMCCMSAMERTLQQWETLLETTGLQTKEIREYDSSSGDSIMITIPI